MAVDELFRIRGLRKVYAVKGRARKADQRLTAVANLDLQIRKGESIALVGESGSGKTTIARLILRLIEATSGEIIYQDEDVTDSSERSLRASLRRQVSMVFQNPGTSLSPHLTVGKILMEPLAIHNIGDQLSRQHKAYEVLRLVGLDEAMFDRYARELSGGQRQRVGIGRALMLNPELIVADEPTSALDVSVQAQIINLLGDLKRDQSLSLLFITHDLTLARHVADRVIVLFLGEICEEGPPDILGDAPLHPYSAILASMESEAWERILPIGDPPSPVERPTGCVFRTRCPIAQPICAAKAPNLVERSDGMGSVACHFPGELKLKATGVEAIKIAAPPLV